MKVVALVSVLFAFATSQPPPRCASPKQWETFAVALMPGSNTYATAVVSYDLINQRFKTLLNYTIYSNSSTPTIDLVEFIFNYGEKMMYEIFPENKSCQKTPLSGPMQPVAVPATAQYVGQVWIGAEDLPGAGVQTELWVGTTPGTYEGLWTQVDCIPILQVHSFNVSQLANYNRMMLYDLTLGIKDPSVFTPPSYCK